MIVRNAQTHAVGAFIKPKVDVEQLRTLRLHHRHGAGVHKLTDEVNILLTNARKHLKLPVRIAHCDARCDGGGDAFKPARVGNDDAFYVFNDVAAYNYVDLVGHFAENLPRFRSGIRHCDRLGAAHGGDKLLPENLQILPVDLIADFH